MQSFKIDNESAESFVSRVNDTIKNKDAGHVLSVSLSGPTLTVRFSYLGTSKLRYSITDTESGFRADLVDKKISPLHGPFRHAFDERFEKVVCDLGGTLI